MIGEFANCLKMMFDYDEAESMVAATAASPEADDAEAYESSCAR